MSPRVARSPTQELPLDLIDQPVARLENADAFAREVNRPVVAEHNRARRIACRLCREARAKGPTDTTPTF